MKKYLALSLFVCLFTQLNVFAQDYGETSGQTYSENTNPITTSVPFMMIAPDSRGAAMGDAGVATSTDGYSQHWNSSKYAFTEIPTGVTVTYTPWLKKLVADMNLAYLTGFYQIDKNQTIGASLRYFSMGNINFTDEAGESLGSYSPNEWAIDASYNRKLSDNFALGIVGRFILSNLTGGQGSTNGEVLNAGTSVAMDINGYYKDDLRLGDYDGTWSAGFNLSNIGAKLGYSETTKNFIPTNLRIGAAMTLDIDKYNSVSATVDLNKLLVPTPPIYDETNTDSIVAGKDSDVGVITGMIQSFNDAPGGFKEELHEITYSVGIEYWYAKQFAVRAGYFHENEYKGNRKYFTAGVGMKMNVFGLDFAYLIPAGTISNSPLANTWRFSLVFDIAAD